MVAVVSIPALTRDIGILAGRLNFKNTTRTCEAKNVKRALAVAAVAPWLTRPRGAQQAASPDWGSWAMVTGSTLGVRMTAEPFAQLTLHLRGFQVAQMVMVAAKLRLADRIADAARTVPELATDCGAHPEM